MTKLKQVTFEWDDGTTLTKNREEFIKRFFSLVSEATITKTPLIKIIEMYLDGR